MDTIRFALVPDQALPLYQCQSCPELRAKENLLIHAIFGHGSTKVVIDTEE